VDSPVKRLVYAPVGAIDGDFDDVRRYHEAAGKGLKRCGEII